MTENNRPEDWIHAIVISPDFLHDGAAYAALQSGLFLTYDRGLTWKPAFTLDEIQTGSGMAYPTATCVCLSPSYPKDHTLWAAVHGAILRSQNSGRSWQFSRFGPTEPTITCLAVSPCYSSDQTLFAGSLEDGLFISSDAGTTWFPWNFGLIESSIISIAVSPDFQHDELVFTATETCLYRSSNSGRSWKLISFPDEDSHFTALTLSPKFGEDSVFYVGAENGLYISNNNQEDNWSQLGINVINKPVESIQFTFLNPNNQILAVLTEGNDLLYSVDFGLSWVKANLVIPSQQTIQAMAIAGNLPGQFTLLAGFSNGRIIPYTCNI